MCEAPAAARDAWNRWCFPGVLRLVGTTQPRSGAKLRMAGIQQHFKSAIDALQLFATFSGRMNSSSPRFANVLVRGFYFSPEHLRLGLL